jgi:pilus assembly protein CpaC
VFSPISGCSVLDVKLRAAESNGLIRTLAEPTLTAISGEKAEFLAGGEFPVPVPTDDGIAIEYKKFGVGLTFTPVVLAGGRISLQVGTEVSEPSSDSITAGAGLRVFGLSVRRANTTVELPSGGTLALAGLLQDNSKHSFTGLPGVINLPVIGSLFRSRDFQRGQTELAILVTPYIAKSNGLDKLALPDDGFSQPTDVGSFFMGQLNKIYAPAMTGSRPYSGPIGHIVE